MGNNVKCLWIIIYLVTLIWSGINPKDPLIWLLEVMPAILGGVLLAATYKSFRLTSLLYGLILAHCIVLMIGGHYTYAEVPLFDGLMNSERNNYDKVGHFFQGFVPAILTREILLRKQVVNGRYWLFFITVSVCLAFSAFYELIEWSVALISEQATAAFLGTQGYVWDTQSDMTWALLGACCALLFLSSWHDKQLRRLTSDTHSNESV